MTTSSIDGQRAYEHARYLSVDIGPRVRGSKGDKKAADYICSYLESLGLEVQEQMFDVEYASLIDHKVEILEPPLGEIPSAPVLLTPDTPKDGLAAELVFVEGSQEPQLGPRVADKIVLWHCSGVLKGDRQRLLGYRPRAVLSIFPGLGLRPKHSQMARRELGRYDPVTSFWITWEDGLRLVRAGARKARLHLRTERHQGTSRNIIAELKGSTHPEQIIVIGGHYDTVPGVPGATDNASGVALVMELARLYAQRGSKRTLRFVAWGAEEGGLLGSSYYVKRLRKQDQEVRKSESFIPERDSTELDRHLFCVNLDTLGMALGHNSCYVLGPPEVTAAMGISSKESGIPHRVSEGIDVSDHLPFACVGVPNVSLVREGPPLAYIHTSDDTIDLIDVAQLEQIGTFVDTFLMRTAAGAHAWPFERQIPEGLAQEVEKMMKGKGWAIEEESV